MPEGPLGLDECGEVGRAAADHGAIAQRLQALHEGRVGRHLAYGLVQPGDGGLGHAGWGHDGVPGDHIVAAQAEIGEGGHAGHMRQEGQGGVGGDGEGQEAAAFHMRHQGGHHVEHHLDIAGQQVIDGGAAAAIGHMQDLRLGGAVDRLDIEMA